MMSRESLPSSRVREQRRMGGGGIEQAAVLPRGRDDKVAHEMVSGWRSGTVRPRLEHGDEFLSIELIDRERWRAGLRTTPTGHVTGRMVGPGGSAGQAVSGRSAGTKNGSSESRLPCAIRVNPRRATARIDLGPPRALRRRVGHTVVPPRNARRASRFSGTGADNAGSRTVFGGGRSAFVGGRARFAKRAARFAGRRSASSARGSTVHWRGVQERDKSSRCNEYAPRKKWRGSF
jgi:hypothetical protein